MAFRERSIPVKNKKPEVPEILETSGLPANEKQLPKANAKSAYQKEADAFREKAKEVLNILEHEHGIDIYDDSRTPGMYLKQRSWGKSKITANINKSNPEDNKRKADNELLSKLFPKNK